MGRCSEGDKHDTYYIDFKDQTGALKHTLATREHRTMHDIKTFSVGYYSGGSLTVDEGTVHQKSKSRLKGKVNICQNVYSVGQRQTVLSVSREPIVDDYTTLPGNSGATHSISLCIAGH